MKVKDQRSAYFPQVELLISQRVATLADDFCTQPRAGSAIAQQESQDKQ
jgi:hypothetical protein